MIYLLAFLLPAVMYSVMLVLTKTFPFGDNALLISDIDNQFAAFYTYFKHVVLTNDNFIYTFSKSLGGDMTGFSGYYLQNPFLFLLLFFKDEYVPAGIVLIIGLQLSLMGVSMAVLLHDIAGDISYDAGVGNTISGARRHTASVLMCSCAYAFMGYNLAYITLPIYFSSLILLPIVMLGIRRIVNGGRRRVYIISLALAIIFNYYIGYMICIFSVLFFVCSLMANGKLKEKKAYIDFILSSTAAGALSAFSVIPTVLSLRGQKDAPALAALKPHINYGLRMLLRNFFTGGFRGDVSNYCAPYIYVGEAVLAGVVFFLVSRRVELKRKLAFLVLFGILIVSTYISTTDVIWHGFNAPVGFAYRYAFLICAVLITAGFKGWLLLDKGSIGSKGTLLWLLAGIEIVLLTVNAVISLNSYDEHSFADYRAYYERMDECISGIKNEDTSFYRIEKDFDRGLCDSMMFDYAGLTHNSSCEKDYVKEFMAKMGIRYFAPIWTYYNQGSTVFTDCFLGVKYFISRFDATDKPYTLKYDVHGTTGSGEERIAYVYDNPYSLSLCFGMDEIRLAADMNNEDLFRIQNEMAGMTIYTSAIEPVSNVDTDDVLSVDVPVTKDCNLYFYATAPDYQGAELLVNDQPHEDYFSVTRWNIVNLGDYRAGDTVNIKLRATDGTIHINNLYVYAEDIEALKEWYRKASAEQGELLKITSSHLSGRIAIKDSDRIVFTVPYEKAWKVRLNGEKVSTKEAFGALLSVAVKPGEYTIDMVYIPEGLIPGIVISLGTLMICLGLTFCPRAFKIDVKRSEHEKSIRNEENELGR